MSSTGPGPDTIKLSGGMPGTASFVYSGPGDSVVIELYDHSSEAQDHFGNDVAFLTHVAAEHKPRMLALLHTDGQTAVADAKLFELLRNRFTDYYSVQRWLDENHIPYEKKFNGQA